MNVKSIEKLELNKVLAAVSEYAATEGGKAEILACAPSQSVEEVRRRLQLTAECDKLLYVVGVGKIEPFRDISDALKRAEKGSDRKSVV